MFPATMCPSSRENTVPMRHLVFVTLYGWLSGMQGGIPQYTCKRNIEARLYNHGWCWKPIIITYSECMFVDLVIQHTKRMRRIIVSHVAYPALPYYSTVSHVAYPALPYYSTMSHKRHDFWKTLLTIKCVFWFSLQLLSETFLILIRNQPVIT
jgi:hypothetical protein